jgi:hypothetical protein
MRTVFWFDCLKEEPLGRPSHRWEYNVRVELREIGWEDVDWMHLAKVRDSGGLLRTR